MNATYTVYLTNRQGLRIRPITDFVDVGGASIHYGRAVNTVSRLDLILPFDRYKDLIKDPAIWLDSRLEVWRRLGNGIEQLETETIWFVRGRKLDMDQRTLTITAYSANELLARRRIAYKAGTAGASKTDTIDDMMKAFVRENLGTLSTDPLRDISTFLTVSDDLGQGVSITKAASYNNLLETLQDLSSQSSYSGSTPVQVFFDVVGIVTTNGVTTLEFRTYINQRGLDRTYSLQNQSVTLSPDTNTLKNVIVIEDYSTEYNVVYALGNGQDSNRAIVEVTDATRIATSPINRRETTTSENSNLTTALTSAGNSALRTHRPKKIITATIANNDTFAYGRDWYWGDKVSANVDNNIFDVRIDAIDVTVSEGQENIVANLRGEI